MVDDTVFMIASQKSLLLFGRETSSPHHLYERNPSFKLLALHESLFTNFGACVISLHVFQCADFGSYLLTGYDNGSIGIFSLGNINMFLDNGELNSFSQAPSLLLVFQAHSPDSRLPFSPLHIQLSPLSIIPGDSDYLREFYTFGSDFKIIHWGLRTCHREAMENSVEVDILGVCFIASTLLPDHFAEHQISS
jgi:hypothetical protein